MAAIDKDTLVTYLQSYTGFSQNIIDNYLDYTYNLSEPDKSYFIQGFSWELKAGELYPKRDDMITLINSYFA